MSMVFTCSLFGEDLVLACGAASHVAEHLELVVPETEEQQQRRAEPKSLSRRQDSEWFSCEDEITWDKARASTAPTTVPSAPSEAGCADCLA